MKIKEVWLSYSRQQKVIILTCIALFLPFYITCMIDAALLLFCLWNHDLQKAYRGVRQAKWVLPFSCVSALVSFYYHNMVGLACTLVFLIVFSVVIFYQYYGSSRLFDHLIQLFIIMSIPCALYGLMEYNDILGALGIKDFAILVFDNPSERLNSVFYNANYYAMMIEFFSLMIIYCLLHTPKKRFIPYYLLTLGLNLLMLYLTGCRTAWPALVLGAFVLVLYHHDRRWLFVVIAVAMIVSVIFMIAPGIFPRTDNIFVYFKGRLKIWQVSWDHIQTHCLFGAGPLTYMHIYTQYPKAIVTQHAHNILIDPILSYGIVGVALIAPYFKGRYDDWKHSDHEHHKTLMKAFLVTTLIHGILDYTVYFVPTGITFLLVLGSAFSKEKTSAASL